MIFLDPTSDIAFKKIFGSTAHKNILIDFLNAVLERAPGEKIVDVIFNDPYNTPETLLSKLSIVDVRCTDEKKNQYIVEVQVEKQSDYAARAQYYSSLALSRQLAKTEKYAQLVPVIFIGIINFNLFSTQNYVSHHLILDTTTHEHALKHLEFHFIELDKFNKNLEELVHILDKWIYFLKNADSLRTIPENFKQYQPLHEAFSLLEQGNWSKKELDEYDAYIDSIRSAESILDTARNEGLLKGKIEGKIEGKLEGEKTKALAIAKNLLDVLDIQTIALKTGLSKEEIETLKRNNQS